MFHGENDWKSASRGVMNVWDLVLFRHLTVTLLSGLARKSALHPWVALQEEWEDCWFLPADMQL